MRIDDERLEKLGTYFVHHQVGEVYGMTFEHFIDLVDCGIWKEIVG